MLTGHHCEQAHNEMDLFLDSKRDGGVNCPEFEWVQTQQKYTC